MNIGYEASIRHKAQLKQMVQNIKID